MQQLVSIIVNFVNLFKFVVIVFKIFPSSSWLSVSSSLLFSSSSRLCHIAHHESVCRIPPVAVNIRWILDTMPRTSQCRCHKDPHYDAKRDPEHQRSGVAQAPSLLVFTGSAIQPLKPLRRALHGLVGFSSTPAR